MTQVLKDKIAELYSKIKGLTPPEALAFFAQEFAGKIIFSTSFSWEDQAISHLIFSNKIPIKAFTLDTGRLFSETYYVWSRTTEMYDAKIEAYYPNEILLQEFVTEKGPNSFYESIENRKGCCHIRKVCLLYTSPSPRDVEESRMPSSA